MLFNSYEFLFVFLPLVFAAFLWAGRRSPALAGGWLALASLFFYGYWSIQALPLLLSSILFNFVMGGQLASNPGQRSGLLKLAVGANLGALAWFKYVNFLIDNGNPLLTLAGLGTLPAMDVVLPIGISFFTFTQIAFLVDCHRGLVRERNLVHYALFVSYFPHLVAGPVLHHGQMMPQFARTGTYRFDAANVASGLILIATGLAKKVLIADGFAPYADAVFGAADKGVALQSPEAWAGALAYTFQIYFDFSGYSDMAIGISRLFNIELPVNFRAPYTAASIIDFWRRWHISLSNFLRDYLYIPLGGNRHGTARRHLNLSLTMLLGGLWHGASWNFVIWGGLHGAYLIINHFWRATFDEFARRGWQRHVWTLAAGMLTFFCVVVAWVFFRAETLTGALSLLTSMAGQNGVAYHWHEVLHGGLFMATSLSGKEFVRLLLLAIVFTWLIRYPEALFSKRWIPTPVRALALGLLLITCLEKFGAFSPYLYFQF